MFSSGGTQPLYIPKIIPGIGPTHDDITYDAMATAFNLPLKLHDPTLERMKRIGMQMLDQNKTENTPSTYVLNEPRKRMALLPFSKDEGESKVIYPSPALWVPIVILNKNVHILPGII